MDLLQLQPQRWLQTVCERQGIEVGQVLWTTYGIPCQTFTHAQDGNRGEKRLEGCAEGHAYRGADGEPIDKAARTSGQQGDLPESVKAKAKVAKQHDRLAKAVVQCIQSLPEGIAWLVENPRAHLRKRPYFKTMAQFENTVNYCCFGGNTAKPTNIWTNAKWQPKGTTQTGKQRLGRCLKDNRCTQGNMGKRLQDWKHPWGIAGAGHQPLVQMEPGEGQRLKNEVPKPLLAQVARASWRQGFTTGMSKLARRAVKWQIATAAVTAVDAAHTSEAREAGGCMLVLGMIACLGMLMAIAAWTRRRERRAPQAQGVVQYWGDRQFYVVNTDHEQHQRSLERAGRENEEVARREGQTRRRARRNRCLMGLTRYRRQMRMLILALFAWGAEAAGIAAAAVVTAEATHPSAAREAGSSGQMLGMATCSGLLMATGAWASWERSRKTRAKATARQRQPRRRAKKNRCLVGWAKYSRHLQLLILAMLAWRADAAGVQEGGSSGAAMMAAAAAGMWIGHPMEDALPQHRMRIGCINVDGLAADGAADQSRLWGELQNKNATVLAMQDHRRKEEYQRRQAEADARSIWQEGEQRFWHWQDPMAQPPHGSIGGTALAATGGAARVADKRISDCRGWGRYSGVVLKSGGTKLKIISVYMPCPSSKPGSLWQRQKELLQREGESTTDPWKAALNDVMKEVDDADDGTDVLIMGDLNVPWDAKGRASGSMDGEEKSRLKFLKRECERKQLCSMWHELHEEEVWTQWEKPGETKGRSHIDHILATPRIMQMRPKMGVLQEDQLCHSRHRLLLLELNSDWMAGAARNRGKKPAGPALKLDSKKSIETFLSKAAQAFPQQAFEDLDVLEQMAAERSGSTEVHEMAQSWGKHLEILVKCELEMRKEQDCRSRRKKDGWSRSLLRLAKAQRAVLLGVRAGQHGKYGRARALRKHAASLVPSNLTAQITLAPIRDRRENWDEWISSTQQVHKELLHRMHGSRRKKARLKAFTWAKQKEQMYKEGKFRQQLARDLGRPRRQGLPREVEDGEGTLHTDPAAVKATLRQAFMEWFGAGRSKWFVGKRLWSTEGKEARKWIADAVPQMKTGDTERDWYDGLPAWVKPTIAEVPQRCWKVLRAAKRKTGSSGRCITAACGMGVPEWVIRMVEELDANSTLYVCTGHGECDAMHPETGWPQGSEEGPQGWVAHYDWMIQLQREADNRDPYIVEDCRLDAKTEDKSGTTAETAGNWARLATAWGIRVFGGVFADDSLWFSRTTGGAQVAANTAEDFLGFHGGQFNVDKSSFIMIRWSQESTDSEARDWEEIEAHITVERVELGPNGNTVSMTMRRLDGNTPERYLGVDMTGTVWWGEVEAGMEAVVKTIAACCRKAKVRRYGARALLQAVAQPKVNHALKWASSSQERLREIWRPAEIAMKAAVRLAISTPGAVAQAMCGPMDHGTRHEQIMALMQLLLRRDLAGSLARNEVARLQLMCGRAVPVMSSTGGAALRRAWRGDWLGRVWSWMASMHITVDGGNALEPTCSADVVLVEAAIGTKYEEQVAEACWQWEVYTMADLTLADGETLRPEARMGGAWMQEHEHNWLKWVASFAGSTHKLDAPLSGARGGTGWHRRGRTVAWIQESTIKLGRLIGVSGEWAAIQEWTEEMGNTRHRSSSRAGSGRGHLLRKGDRWCERAGRGKQSAAPLHCIFPVDMGDEGPQDGHRQVWTCVSSAEWLESYMAAAPPPQQEIDEDSVYSQ